MNKFIPVCEPYLPGNEKKYVLDTISTNWISSAGNYIEEFEKKFSKFCGVNYGVCCTSCYAALHLACLAIGLKKGDEVIIPSFTMLAPLAAVIQTGAKPVLVDANSETYCIDVDKIEEKINEKTKAIMPVHIYGHPCNMDKILDIAKKYNLKVIEDAAEAHGAEYKGKKVGSFGNIGCFSFYGNKIITTGEGGMAITNNSVYYEKMKKLKNYAFEHPRFLHNELGVNYRMSNIHAAIGLAQTENADMLVEARRNVGLRYNRLLKDVKGIILPKEKENCKNVYWMYGIVLNDDVKLSRDEVVKKLRERGVDTRNFFIPMHKQPVFLEKKLENVPDCNDNYPVSEKIGVRGFYLPSSSNLSEEDAIFVCDKLKEVLDELNN
ncbi:MAG: DegT/DnrJ/EryC1/StrS family aminotransferase [Nanoarchaeota archaeon]